MLEEYIGNAAIDYFKESPVGVKLKKAIDVFEKVQENLYALADKKDESSLTLIKCGTILTFSVLKKLVDGKRLNDFSESDWKDVVGDISQYAILLDDRKYSESVFLLYARYIDYSAANIEGKASDKLVTSVRVLAQELRDKTDALEKGTITEVAYTEDCLWICLDAMVKLLASCVRLVSLPGNATESTELEKVGAPTLAEEFSVAITSIGFEYGRYMLYKKEQAILSSYIDNQHRLDDELEKKYDAFTAELQEYSENFHSLLENAFSPNFRDAFLKSAAFARAAGVGDDEILTSVKAVDDFFLD